MNKSTTSRRNKNTAARQSSGDGGEHGLRGPHFKIEGHRPGPHNRDTTKPLLTCTNLKKSYRKAAVEIPVLRGVDLEIYEGEFQSIIGQSGSGKSTLLHILATLDQPDSGEIHFEGNRIDNIQARGRDTLRNRYLSMVFQFYHLLPELTTVENVLLPSMISSSFFQYLSKRGALKKRALELLELVGLSHRLKHLPRELSGGEMQRVAIARSLMQEPKVLLADEPTGNLDRKTGGGIMEVLRRLNQDHALTIVMVTHDQTIAEQADRTLRMEEGRVESKKTTRRAS